MKRAIWLVLIFAALVALAASPTSAQTPASASTPTPNEIDAIAKELWCPLCNGVRLDNCELQACIQMREVISEKLAAGESKDQIRAYFAQQYGDVVLGTPSREGFNLVIWLFPILAVLVGLGGLAYLITIWRKRQPAAQPVQADSAAQKKSDDEYLKRVDEELKRLD
jgi:cytochrome c-type biogenesis protein CcmH